MSNLKYFYLLFFMFLDTIIYTFLIIFAISYCFILAPDISNSLVISYLNPLENYQIKKWGLISVQILFVLFLIKSFYLAYSVKFIEEFERLKKLNKKHYKKFFEKEELYYEFHKYCVENRLEVSNETFNLFLKTLPSKIIIEN
jgi:hypothetical protein